MRPGEKLHEEMITATDAMNTLEFEKHLVILPSMRLWDVDEYKTAFVGDDCKEGFAYSSSTNEHFLTVEDLRELIREHVSASTPS